MAELYLNFPKVAGAPLKALRGFQRIHLEPGASQEVKFELKPRDLSMVSEAGEPIVPEGEFTLTVGGSQPNGDSSHLSQTFRVKNTLSLAGVAAWREPDARALLKSRELWRRPRAFLLKF